MSVIIFVIWCFYLNRVGSSCSEDVGDGIATWDRCGSGCDNLAGSVSSDHLKDDGTKTLHDLVQKSFISIGAGKVGIGENLLDNTISLQGADNGWLVLAKNGFNYSTVADVVWRLGQE